MRSLTVDWRATVAGKDLSFINIPRTPTCVLVLPEENLPLVLK
jgi:hypothetical protein